VFGFLLVVLILIGLFMTVVILLQAGKGGGLAALGGAGGMPTDGVIGGRQAATLLTKSTWISGGLFLALSLTLSVISSRQAGPDGSILRGQFQAPAVTPTPVLPGAGAVAPAPGETPAGAARQAPAQPEGPAPAPGGTP
jgi:preprotein translocase subunit SecG